MKYWLTRSLFVGVLACGARAHGQELEPSDDQDAYDLEWNPAWDTPFWPSPGPVSLDLRAGHGWTQSVAIAPGQASAGAPLRQEGYLLALLTLPLDGRRPQPSPSPASPGSTDEDDVELSQDASAAAEPAEPALLTGSQPERATVERPTARSLAALADSGPESAEFLPLSLVDEVIRRARVAAGLHGAEHRLTQVASRARLSGLTPELRLRGVQGVDQTRSLDTAGLLPGDQTTRDGVDSLVEVRLTFHLERLLFSGQEPGLERARAQLRKDRADLSEQVIQLLTEWRAARSSASQWESGELDAETLLASERACLRLYLLTDGWFAGERTLARYRAPAATHSP